MGHVFGSWPPILGSWVVFCCYMVRYQCMALSQDGQISELLAKVLMSWSMVRGFGRKRKQLRQQTKVAICSSYRYRLRQMGTVFQDSGPRRQGDGSFFDGAGRDISAERSYRMGTQLSCGSAANPRFRPIGESDVFVIRNVSPVLIPPNRNDIPYLTNNNPPQPAEYRLRPNHSSISDSKIYRISTRKRHMFFATKAQQ